MTGAEARRVALITGGARGLGREVAAALAREGVAVFLVDILGDRLAATQAELEAQGAVCRTFPTDIAERANCVAAVDAAVATYGRLDILVNAAAIVRFDHTPD